MSRRCGRLDDHPAHDWNRPRSLVDPAATFHCAGTVVVAYVERQWADDRDAEDAADDLRRADERELGEYVRQGWAS